METMWNKNMVALNRRKTADFYFNDSMKCLPCITEPLLCFMTSECGISSRDREMHTHDLGQREAVVLGHSDPVM